MMRIKGIIINLAGHVKLAAAIILSARCPA
jgi:hypothetical protein